MTDYLVGNSDEGLLSGDLRLVVANSQSDAIDRYIEKFAVMDELFLESISDKSINSSFMEQFALVGEDFDKFMEAGYLELDKERIELRVRRFFSDKQSFADLYLNYYFSDESLPGEVNDFPADMLEWMFLASNFMKIDAIAVNKIQQL